MVVYIGSREIGIELLVGHLQQGGILFINALESLPGIYLYPQGNLVGFPKWKVQGHEYGDNMLHVRIVGTGEVSVSAYLLPGGWAPRLLYKIL